jgi:hypothetical protein
LRLDSGDISSRAQPFNAVDFILGETNCMLDVDLMLELIIFILAGFLIIVAGGTFYIWWNGYHKPESHTRQRIHYKRHRS